MSCIIDRPVCIKCTKISITSKFNLFHISDDAADEKDKKLPQKENNKIVMQKELPDKKIRAFRR